ncbi:MAG: hypothetical protein ORN58_01740, partial [Sediminibacterium sp.]|nr:hypothetical protein [Sediminibacterium sp.]
DSVVLRVSTNRNIVILTTDVKNGQIDSSKYVSTRNNIRVTYRPNCGHYLDSVYINGVYDSAVTKDSVQGYTFVNVGLNISIKAVYSPYTIQIEKTGLGSINRIYKNGILDSVEIVPDANNYLRFISINGIQIDTGIIPKVNGIYKIAINYNINKCLDTNYVYQVGFEKIKYRVVSIVSVGGGINVSKDTIVTFGDSVRYNIISNNGYQLQSVITLTGGEATTYNPTNNQFVYTVPGTTNIFFNFIKIPYSINIAYNVGGSIVPVGYQNVNNSNSYAVGYNYGDSVLIQINNNNGYYLDSLYLDSVKISNTNRIILNNITKSHSIKGVFKAYIDTISISSGLNGSISPIGNIYRIYNDSVRFVIRPNQYYQLDSVILDGININTSNAIDSIYWLRNIQKNYTLRVSFKSATYKIVSAASVGGTITPLGT